MKKTIFVLLLILGIVYGVFCQSSGVGVISGPMDLVVLLDTSASMSNSYQATSDYLIGPFLKEFLRIGDTFHLISFSGSPKVEISRRIEAVGDVEAVIGRLLLMYPLDPQSDVAGALTFAEKYSSSLPGNRYRRVILITDGDAPGTQNLVTDSSNRLKSQGGDLQYIKVPVTGNGPSSGRPVQTAQAAPQAAQSAQPVQPAQSGAQTAQTTQTGQSAQPSQSTQTKQTAQTAQSTQTAQGGAPASQTPPAQTQAKSNTPPAAAQEPASPPVTSKPDQIQAPAQTTGTSQAGSSASSAPSASGTEALPPAAGGTTPPAGSTSTSSGQSGGTAQTGASQPSSGQTVQPPQSQGTQQTQTQTAQSSEASQSGTSGRAAIFSGDIPLPLIIALIILALLILGLIIFFAARHLHNSPNRVMAQAAAPMDYSDRVDAHRQEQIKDAELMGDYAKARATQRKPMPKDQVYDAPVQESEGPLMLNLFVEDQNTAIGRRNIHAIKAGYTFSVGGGKSDFLIFLVPIPPHIADVQINGNNCTFIPRKPQYFPDIGSQSVPSCIGKSIRVISDKNYELHIRMERYEDPLKALNKMLHSISVPGEVK